MKKALIIVAAVVFSVCFGAGAFAQEKKAEAAPKKAAASTEKPKVVKERTVTRTATVEAIDLPNRVVTLKDKDGNLTDLKVGEQAKNLPQVKVGDQVTAKYYESVAVELADPGSAPGVGASASASRAKVGDMPGGKDTNTISVIANIEAIDTKANIATLKGPDGKIVKVKIQDPKKWQSAKAGDKLKVTYTEAIAIEVKPVEKKAEKK